MADYSEGCPTCGAKNRSLRAKLQDYGWSTLYYEGPYPYPNGPVYTTTVPGVGEIEIIESATVGEDSYGDGGTRYIILRVEGQHYKYTVSNDSYGVTWENGDFEPVSGVKKTITVWE